jgi:hypothetical protein
MIPRDERESRIMSVEPAPRLPSTPDNMALQTVTVAQVNGDDAISRDGSPLSINSATKRKRDVSDDGSAELNGNGGITPRINGVHKTRSQKGLIRDYFEVLRRYAPNLDDFSMLITPVLRCLPPIPGIAPLIILDHHQVRYRPCHPRAAGSGGPLQQ